MTHCPVIEHFSSVSVQHEGTYMKGCSKASGDITDIISLEWGRASRSYPIKPTRYRTRLSISRASLPPTPKHTMESSAVPISLIYVPFKNTLKSSESKSIKVVKTQFQTLGNEIILWRKEAGSCVDNRDTKSPALDWGWWEEHETAWLDKSIRTQQHYM